MEYNPSKSESARTSELSSRIFCGKGAPKVPETIEGEDSFADFLDEVMNPEGDVDSKDVARRLESISCHSAVGMTGLSERFSISGAYLQQI
jgi:hypothetical protein